MMLYIYTFKYKDIHINATINVVSKELPKKETKELAEKRVNQWRKEEGEKVAMFLGQKSLLNTSTAKGTYCTSRTGTML